MQKDVSNFARTESTNFLIFARVDVQPFPHPWRRFRAFRIRWYFSGAGYPLPQNTSAVVGNLKYRFVLISFWVISAIRPPGPALGRSNDDEEILFHFSRTSPV